MSSKFEETYRRSIEKPDDFWAEAAEELHWFQRWDRVLDDSRPPFTRWFSGGRVNTCYNAVDRHVAEGRGEQAALIWYSPVAGAAASLTYRELQTEVAVLAGALRGLGVEAGDRVLIYMRNVRKPPWPCWPARASARYTP